MCSILIKLIELAYEQFDSISDRTPPSPPDLDRFAQSDLARLDVPTDPYLDSAQSYGADFSTLSGQHAFMPPSPNGKAAKLESGLVSARHHARLALEGLSQLPNGVAVVDKHGSSRVTFGVR